MDRDNLIALLLAALNNPDNADQRSILADALIDADMPDQAQAQRSHAMRLRSAAQNKGCNGWSNYETWNVALWIDNDQGTQEFWREQTILALQGTRDTDDIETRKEDAAHYLSALIGDWVDEQQEECGAHGFLADLLSSAVSEVNYGEIAESMIGNIDDADWIEPADDEDEDDDDDDDDATKEEAEADAAWAREANSPRAPG